MGIKNSDKAKARRRTRICHGVSGCVISAQKKRNSAINSEYHDAERVCIIRVIALLYSRTILNAT